MRNRIGTSKMQRIGKMRTIECVKTILGYMAMIILVAFVSLPLIYVISTAFKPIDELFIFPPKFLVQRPTFQNFYDLTSAVSSSTVPFLRYVLNSILVTTITVSSTCVICSMGAYGLLKYNAPGSKTIFAFIIAALMFSPHVTQIPRYMVVSFLGIIDSYTALIVPGIAVAYNLFLMKQFLEQFPNELIEAARIDGTGEFRLFWKIVMPALTPAWSTLIVFSFVTNWNDYFTPLIYTTSSVMKTLPLALQNIAGGPGVMSIGRAGAVAAATMLMTIPTVVIFSSMQAKVMETLTYSGIKG